MAGNRAPATGARLTAPLTLRNTERRVTVRYGRGGRYDDDPHVSTPRRADRSLDDSADLAKRGHGATRSGPRHRPEARRRRAARDRDLRRRLILDPRHPVRV